MLKQSDVDGLLTKHAPGIVARDLRLYQRAVTHRSAAAAGDSSYERLEFLGDAVLNLVVASYLFERYPKEDEGFMTRMRTKLINGVTLAHLCKTCTRLGDVVQMKESRGSRGKAIPDAVMEDVFEAFLGAIFLDHGFDVARAWLVSFFEANVDFAQLVARQNNPKDVLNRHFVSNFGSLPRFEEVPPRSSAAAPTGTGGDSGGMSNKKKSRPQSGSTALIRDARGVVVATGTGKTLREAEYDAARRALAYYGVPAGTTV